MGGRGERERSEREGGERERKKIEREGECEWVHDTEKESIDREVKGVGSEMITLGATLPPVAFNVVDFN